MAEDDKTVDIDDLSDEDFMKLGLPTGEEAEKTEEEGQDDDGTSTDADDDPVKAETEDTAEDESVSEEGDDKTEETEVEEEESEEEPKGVNDDKETLTLKDKKNEGSEDKVDGEEEVNKEDDDVTEEAVAKAFFDKVSAPFKADGKEVQIRTPEEAVRLMQMGVNYSRRMAEMKPLREMDAMLTQHGLNDPNKLNELIDLSKGSKEAIQKYLKKHAIDPLDLDTSKGDEHTTPNYRSDPKDVAFQEAINTTLEVEGGKELLVDVNKDWDDESKEALRENPSIFGKLLDQKETGVYEQINAELLHQRTMGYLAGVPFIQAYEQVGNAMQKAGVFDAEPETTQKKGLAPIASGPRKTAPKPKTEQSNPNLSSTKPTRKAVTKEAVNKEPDYLSMSDEDFMKLGQPG